MGQCQSFRAAAEILYQISRSDPVQQSGLRALYRETIENAALTAKVTPGEMHVALLKRSEFYSVARMQGKSREEAFALAAKGDPQARVNLLFGKE